MTKRFDTTGSWFIGDTAREPYNVAGNSLLSANGSGAEGGQGVFDILSNGFKMRNTDPSNNASGNTYVFAAFAEHPFKYARAR